MDDCSDHTTDGDYRMPDDLDADNCPQYAQSSILPAIHHDAVRPVATAHRIAESWLIIRAPPSLPLLHETAVDANSAAKLVRLLYERAWHVWPTTEEDRRFNAVGFGQCSNPEWNQHIGDKLPLIASALNACYASTFTTRVLGDTCPCITIPHTTVVIRHLLYQTNHATPGLCRYRIYTLQVLSEPEILISGCDGLSDFSCRAPLV
jgi:hypothetical protein